MKPPAGMEPFFEKFKRLCRVMDEKYHEAAQASGFECQGCRDNCCMTHFYHHTFLEYFYLIQGYDRLDDETRRLVLKKAVDARQKAEAFENEKKDARPRIMCPVNIEGRCALYERRPMICRLHGVACEMRRGPRVLKGPGCGEFDVQSKESKGGKHAVLDRTPLYMEMARLEKSVRQSFGLPSKIKMTVAEMIAGHKDPAGDSP
ncbi:conserved hypothetical protein [Candidatus Desulfarcum epimagneticum]|uniref:Zinc/iron-chelating domain-containing protein n=1 Tax=uncultured Desulfobacteraceae bacterium TaxID=218296 RepID=A0A484HE04_9BACT|nr:conserved hypothetical protein [uncultured Desulfobacteraceae bacterium]